MKRISLLLYVFVLFCGFLTAQNDKIGFNKISHDFGIIGDKDGSVSYDFILTNKSNAPIVIANVSTSCGCTSPYWTREPIEPKKTGSITITYNPSGQSGQFQKSISISTSDGSRSSLSIRGEVVNSETIVKKLPPEEEYPVSIGNYLLKTKNLSFEQVDLNEKKTITLEVFNNSDKAITQKATKLPKYITVDLDPAVIPAKTAATVNVNLEVLDKSLYGELSGEILLQINGINQSFPYSANVVEDFSKWTASKKANAGKIFMSTSVINFGNLSTGNSRSLKISNSGKSALNIHSIKSYDPAITVSKANFTINPGEIVEVKVNVDSKKVKTDLTSKLLITSDDPNKSIYEITVRANK